ncbi:poly [ADP-ribose] polymerase tankyrase-2-like [Clytia hemisphaerica]|uniref:poly [ADP-ribose] polymerase tankyrase-2-like n=1 Tax=Clytia hemisphaerica TaxID=252671 RepID=UPI0034D3F8DB
MHCIISFSLNRPTEKQQVTKPKPLPRTGIQLYDSQEQVTPKPAQPTTPTEKQQVTKPIPLPRTGIQLYDSQKQVTPKPAQPTTTKWDGKKIHEIVFQGKRLSFDDVWKILSEKNFTKFEEIFQQNPNIVNSLRDSFDQTLLMKAVYEDRFDVFVHLMDYPHDFSLVDNDGENVLHFVGSHGTVRYLEKFDQQTIKMLINGRDKSNNDTPLHYAASWNKHDVIRWLLAKGANPELKNNRGQRPDERGCCDGVTKEIFRSFRSS